MFRKIKNAFTRIKNKIVKEKHRGNKVIYKVCGIRFDISPQRYLVREIKRLTAGEDKYKKIIILFNHTGETSFILSGLYQNATARELDSVLLIGTLGYHKDLVDLYCPGVDYIYRPDLLWIHVKWGNRQTTIIVNSVSVILTLVFKYFIEYEKTIRGEENFLNFFDNLFKGNPRFIKPQYLVPVISEQQKRILADKIKAASVYKKYILICNESSSNMNFPWWFWFELSRAVRLLGYDVVFNTLVNSPASSLGKSFYTTLGEGIELAEKAECVIGLRSGFLDLAFSVSKQMVVLYTPFKYRGREFPNVSASKIQKAFPLIGLSQNRCNLIEYVIEDPDVYECHKLISMIISNLNRGK